MAPIRLALIGLSSSAKTAWASKAHLPYLLSEKGKSKYTIVALLNSSVAAAKDAIAAYDLPSTVKAYGDPAALAADPDVDLVVCTTRVDKHYLTSFPSIEAGKDTFIEWPLAQDAHHARFLTEKAKEKGIKTLVALQGPLGPLPEKLREVLVSGRIGKVLSSEVRAFGGINSRDSIPEGLKYFTDLKIGGNYFHIQLGHLSDFLQSVLGEATPLGAPLLQIQRPSLKVTADSSGAVLETVTSNTPDLIAFNATLSESSYVAKGASLGVRLRRGQAYPGDPALVWNIHGEKGEIRIVSPTTTLITIGSPTDPQEFEIHDFESDKVEKIEWKFEDWQEELPYPARNIAAIYEQFYEEKTGGKIPGEGETKARYASFEHALKRHEQLEGLLKGAGFL